MCGFVGFLSRQEVSVDQVLKMALAIKSRGPDSSGTWVDVHAGIALAHRRLAIIDTTNAGHQPMVSTNKRLILAFNGEIYNHQQIRQSLLIEFGGILWRGGSDTETLLTAIEKWGIPMTLERLNGMFAFALWDRDLKTITLAVDRMGEKPLYYGKSGNSFLFGSELKALSQHSTWNPELDHSSMSLYFKYGYIPAPLTIYKNIYKLPPSSWIQIHSSSLLAGSISSYWNPLEVMETATHDRHIMNSYSTIDELEKRISDAVGLRMESDVPLGAFLSGGIDSSTIVALMQSHSSLPVNTYTIGFENSEYNEADDAIAIAKHLGTSHTEICVTAEDALSSVPELSSIWDEPFADSSQIPTLLLSRLTRQSVTVALSGDGGDELFCGYNRYCSGFQLYKRSRRVPRPLRDFLGHIAGNFSPRLLDSLLSILPSKFSSSAGIASRLNKISDLLLCDSEKSYFDAMVSGLGFKDPSSILVGSFQPADFISLHNSLPNISDFRELMMAIDATSYLPGDILTKVDRASMAASLEVRTPFLDHSLIEWAWRLPFELKHRNGLGKYALRQVLHKYVPSELLDRPKQGFGIPLEHWLNSSLSEWADDLLDPVRLSRQGLLNVDYVQKLLLEHRSGRKRWHHQLWTILMFQSWHDRWVDNSFQAF